MSGDLTMQLLCGGFVLFSTLILALMATTGVNE